MFEVRKWYRDVDECRNQINNDFDFSFQPKFTTHDIPLVIALMIFAIIMGFLSWKLYRQFGWNIYKKIGGDIRKQAIFRTYLIYVMLLKLGLFFILGAALEACTVFKINLSGSVPIKHNRYLPRRFYYFHIGVSGLIILNQIIGYRSVKKEMKSGMRFVCVFWVVTIIDFCILLYYSIGNVKESWYFFIMLLIVGIMTTVFSLIWTIFVHNNFGKGLQEHIDQKGPSVDTNTLDPKDKRFSIED
jgi:preprotein translocase subunit SecG